MKQLLILLLLLPLPLLSQNDGTINSGDSRLYYRTFGSGKPLLIINGGPGMNSNGFVTLAEKLAVNNQAILYDQRGTGRSTIEKTDAVTITMDKMIADIENLRKHLGFDNWSVLGHSFGGMLASYYAVRHPEAIDKLIMSSSGGVDLQLTNYVGDRINERLSVTERDSLAFWNRRLSAGDTSFTARIGRGRALAPAYVCKKSNAPIIAQRLTEGNAELNGLIWSDLRKINFDCKEKLADYDKTVLIIQGKNDILDVETAMTIQKTFKNSKLVLLDKCGHYGWLDRETDYFAAIDNYLKN